MEVSQAQEYYADPRHQVPAGPARQRHGRRLTATVPVRFPQAAIDSVKRLADHDGVTVSSWIRRVVMHEVMRRQPAAVTAPSQPARFEIMNTAAAQSETEAQVAPDRRVDVECFA